MILDIPREDIDNILDTGPAISSAELRIQVLKARSRQSQRFEGTSIVTNSNMSSKDIDHYITLDHDSKEFLSQASRKFTLSPRVIHRSIKLARTIADMLDQDDIQVQHLAEALQYRDKRVFVD